MSEIEVYPQIMVKGRICKGNVSIVTLRKDSIKVQVYIEGMEEVFIF